MKLKYTRVCVVGLVAAVSALAWLLTANHAVAQTCPYPFDNCPTTTTSKKPQPVIVLDLQAAVPGQKVRLLVCGYAPGTVVKITLNGIVVATFTVGNEPPKSCKGKGGVSVLGGGGDGQALVAAVGPAGDLLRGRLTAQAAPVSGAEGEFTVPTDLAPGKYLVCSEAPGVDSACANFEVTKAGGLASTNNGSSLLAFTGAGLVRLLALAAGLIAVGWMLVSREESAPSAR